MSAVSGACPRSSWLRKRGRVARSRPSNTYGITGPTKAGHPYNKIERLSREFPISGMDQNGNFGEPAHPLLGECTGAPLSKNENSQLPRLLGYGCQKPCTTW